MKLNYIALGPCEFDIQRNVTHAKALGLPEIPSGRGLGRLAVIAGGPSINDKIDEISGLDCDVWAVNGAFQWCLSRGIDATFFSVDSNPTLEKLTVGAERAILATMVAPEVFSALRGKDVRVFETGVIAGVHTGPTSVTSIPALALHAGYSQVTFYGCEGSYSSSHTHAYPDSAENPWQLQVACGGQVFDTEAEYHMQSMYLSDCIRNFPVVFRERSGGLLGALVENGESDVLAVSPALKAILREDVR